MTGPELVASLAAMGVTLRLTHEGPTLVLPEGVTLSAEDVACLKENRETVLVGLYPGHHCNVCDSTLYVSTPELVRQLCQRPMCPSYDPRYWPKWADSFRWWENKRAMERAEREAREAEPLPE